MIISAKARAGLWGSGEGTQQIENCDHFIVRGGRAGRVTWNMP